MDLSQLRPPRGAKKDRKRVGRGNASGQGTYAGKGMKGAQARSGPGPYPGFEGGQLPLVRRMARKRGFKNPFRVEYEEVKITDLRKFDGGATVGPDELIAAGIVKRPSRPIKVLGGDTLDRVLNVTAHRFTASARQAIEAAGGRVEELTPASTEAEEPVSIETARTDHAGGEAAFIQAPTTTSEAPASIPSAMSGAATSPPAPTPATDVEVDLPPAVDPAMLVAPPTIEPGAPDTPPAIDLVAPPAPAVDPGQALNDTLDAEGEPPA